MHTIEPFILHTAKSFNFLKQAYLLLKLPRANCDHHPIRYMMMMTMVMVGVSFNNFISSVCFQLSGNRCPTNSIPHRVFMFKIHIHNVQQHLQHWPIVMSMCAEPLSLVLSAIFSSTRVLHTTNSIMAAPKRFLMALLLLRQRVFCR